MTDRTRTDPLDAWQDAQNAVPHPALDADVSANGQEPRADADGQSSGAPTTRAPAVTAAGDGTATYGADADDFFDRYGLVVERVAETISVSTPVALGTDNRLWRYHGGVWTPDGAALVKDSVRRLLGDRAKQRHYSEVLAWFDAHWPTISDRQPDEWINVRNGLLDWRTGTLHPHSPDVRSTIQLPTRWNPDAACPLFDRFVGDVAPADAVAFIHELVGYLAFTGNPYRKAIMLLGPGGNGKSTFLDAVTAMLGGHNVASVPLQAFGENRFAAAQLYGRLANICGDLDARAIERTDTFKMMTGGDRILAERKYRDAFEFTPYAVPVFSANEPPFSADQSEAWFDRWIILPFTRRLAEHERDETVKTRLATDQDEHEGMLVRAVAGLQRLTARGHFAYPDSIRAAAARYRRELDTAVGFIADECHLAPDAWSSRAKLYRAYTAWCRDVGRGAFSATKFYEHLRARGDLAERKRNGIRGYAGITLREGGTEL